MAMCADDVVCTGAEPLFFLDYLAVGRVDPTRVASLVEGVVEGCRRVGCALLGGETAEHPGVMDEDALRSRGLLCRRGRGGVAPGPHRVSEGDVVIGLASTGLHANGYSLVRSALLPAFDLEGTAPGLDRPLADEPLLEPCAIYTPDVVALARDGLPHAAAHVTGGGIPENSAPSVAGGPGSRHPSGELAGAPIYGLVRDLGRFRDGPSTFNMGLGMLLVVEPTSADDVLSRCTHPAFRIGEVTAGPAFASCDDGMALPRAAS